MARVKLSPLLASLSGSIGNATFQRNKYGVTLRNKPNQRKNVSMSQSTRRSYVSYIIASWHSLTAAQQAVWVKYALSSRHSVKHNKFAYVSGYVLFVKYNLLRLTSGLALLSVPVFDEVTSFEVSFDVYTENEYTTIGLGSGSETMVKSDNGVDWSSLGDSIFSTYGYCCVWNGDKFVAGGAGGNTLAYSANGSSWTALGTSIFSSECRAVCWSGSMFVAVGTGTNTIAYSYDGINWTGLGDNVFSGNGRAVAFNGSMFIAAGNGANTLAYSYDGLSWTGLGVSIFSSSGYAVCWNGSIWSAGGQGGNTLAYSANGLSWTGIGSTVFYGLCYGITWNGLKFCGFGAGVNSLAYSSDGITWVANGSTFLSSHGRGGAGKYTPNVSLPFKWDLTVEFGGSLSGNDLWGVLKASFPCSRTSPYRSSNMRVIMLDYPSAGSCEISEAYKAVFGLLPCSGQYVWLSLQLFGEDTAKIFPVTKALEYVEFE